MPAPAFHPVILLPTDYEIYDFTVGYDPQRLLRSPYGVGRYDEKRPGMYGAEIFRSGQARDVHMGIDIGAPVGTPVHAFDDGEVFLFAYNAAPGDYGHTLITQHRMPEGEIFALFGHLSERSLEGKRVGQRIQRGEIIAWVGDRHENGGWNPHLHFQLARERPLVCDMPGVVSEAQRESAKKIYPDPRLVLGPLY